MKLRSLFLILSISIIAIGCSNSSSDNPLFEQDTDACQSQKMSTQFIVKWKDGTVSKVYAKNKDDFLQNYLEPNAQFIERAEYDRYIQIDPPRTSSGFQTMAFADNWGIDDIDAPAAWSQGIAGSGVVVAVIDSAVDITHPQLINQIAYNSGEDGMDENGSNKRTNGIDDDGNGYIDDYAGFDFITRGPLLVAGDLHGTHVAGIIAAEHSDTTHQTDKVQGVAPQAKIMPLRFIDSSGGGSLGDAIAAIRYARKAGVDIINASWGGAACSKILQTEINKLADSDIIFVSAAGNATTNIDFFPEYPASYAAPTQLTVGSIGPHGFMADHSNYGDAFVHLFAPGEDIYSTVPGGGNQALTGTSMATPAVAGVAALLKSSNPNATAIEIHRAIMSGSRKNATYRNQSQGTLDVPGALSGL